MSKWIGFYIIDLLFWLWVLNYEGAKVPLVRILCMPIVYLFKFSSKAEIEVVRGIAYITIIGHTIVFLLGLGSEDFRQNFYNFIF